MPLVDRLEGARISSRDELHQVLVAELAQRAARDSR
jgi:hypothetical protein